MKICQKTVWYVNWMKKAMNRNLQMKVKCNAANVNANNTPRDTSKYLLPQLLHSRLTPVNSTAAKECSQLWGKRSKHIRQRFIMCKVERELCPNALFATALQIIAHLRLMIRLYLQSANQGNFRAEHKMCI